MNGASARNPSPLEASTDMELICGATFSEVIEREKELLNFANYHDYIALNIGIALSYILDLLPRSSRIFYVGFSGTKGSGKSTATSFCARVCKNGTKLEGVTFAALADACRRGKTLCLDEFDAQSDRCPELETIVRQGVDLDAQYSKMTSDSQGGWRCELIPCGGMKFLNWRNPIDDALLQRILVIKMAPGASTRMIMNNEAPERFTSPLRTWFVAQAAGARQKWDQDTVRALIEDAEGILERRLEQLRGRVPRQIQKMLWMLVVCEIFGWDLDQTIRTIIDEQPEDEAFDDHKEMVLEIWRQRMELHRGKEPVKMSLSDFKKDLSQRMKDRGLPPLRHKGAMSWTALRQECGFLDGVNEMKVSSASGKKYLLFDERVLRAIDAGADLQKKPGESGRIE